MSTVQEKIDAVLGTGTPKVSKSAMRELLYNINVEYVEITATRNIADFNSIREILATITDATDSKRYIVKVPAGEWFECDILGKKYVELVGEGIDKTVIYCDGRSDKNTPSDYSVSAFRNVPLNSFDMMSKHVFYTFDDVIIKNMTVKGTDVRYVMHIDSDTYNYIHAENVKFVMFPVPEARSRSILGLGVRGHQEVVIDKCILEIEKNTTDINKQASGVFIHNHTAPQTSPMKFTISNSHFIRCKYLTIEAFNTTQADELNLINCTTADLLPSIYIKDSPGGSSIRINTSGTNIDKIVSTPALYLDDPFYPNDPLFMRNIASNFAKKGVLAGVTPGTLIQGGVTYQKPDINQFSIYDGSDVFLGIAVTATDDDGYIYVATSGKVAKAPVTGVATKFVKINASNQLEFESTKTIDTVGINLGLVSTGVYEIKLL